jgi:hypothetical protein
MSAKTVSPKDLIDRALAKEALAALPAAKVHTCGLPLTAECRVMVLLSGFPDTASMWTAQHAEFAKDFHMVSIATPDYDQASLRREWGYEFSEVLQVVRSLVTRSLNPLSCSACARRSRSPHNAMYALRAGGARCRGRAPRAHALVRPGAA